MKNCVKDSHFAAELWMIVIMVIKAQNFDSRPIIPTITDPMLQYNTIICTNGLVQ